MTDASILKDGVLNFFFKKEEGKCLSNFWKGRILISQENEEREYDSGESCFHGEKFTRVGRLCKDETRKNQLTEYGKMFLNDVCKNDGNLVKKMGRALILTNSELELWNGLSISVQEEICKYKFDNYEVVRDELQKSKSKILVHPALRCGEDKLRHRLWEGKGIVVDGKIKIIGKNMLGDLWMKLRDTIP
jgi:predicted NAD-dependent protein-ADP-ribosyltransferase YbiA (DUF1768 family)